MRINTIGGARKAIAISLFWLTRGGKGLLEGINLQSYGAISGAYKPCTSNKKRELDWPMGRLGMTVYDAWE
jgi:hypothetical protein